ncbi:MAG: CapA family protein [Actinomycetota bacterium]|nr:CapA family protein [Actinomycetota bacterium]
MRGARTVVALALGSAVTLAACSSAPESAPKAPGNPVTIAFAGDVHFAGNLAGQLENPSTAMGPMATTLASADLAVLNLETAVTTRGSAQPKQFAFRAPPAVFHALKGAGVDVVTKANNHALDYGESSVPDALSAAKAAGLPVVGIGENAAQAYAPWVTTVKGQRIAFLAATAVLDDSLVGSWSAGPDQAGLATALDGDNAAVVAAVRAIRPSVDTVVVELHYGKDLTTCPTQVQTALADALVAAGADIVVGQHAHVLLGGGFHGSAYIDYGMGNFEFYVSNGSRTSETGVLVLTATGRAISDPQWHPGKIVDGLPNALTGSAATTANTRWEALRGCTGLTTLPMTAPQAG